MKIRYFASIRRQIGTDEENLNFDGQVTTVAQLAVRLAARSPEHTPAFADMDRVRCAVNQEFAGLDTPVTDADEVAFFPPVTGG